MRAKAKANDKSRHEERLELKYCERCGGLWLRPVDSGQIYCVACGRAMAELPPASREPETAQLPRGPRWGADDGDCDGYEGDEDRDVDASAGVA
jgi:Zn-finger nucleic acid-binding protein